MALGKERIEKISYAIISNSIREKETIFMNQTKQQEKARRERRKKQKQKAGIDSLCESPEQAYLRRTTWALSQLEEHHLFFTPMYLVGQAYVRTRSVVDEYNWQTLSNLTNHFESGVLAHLIRLEQCCSEYDLNHKKIAVYEALRDAPQDEDIAIRAEMVLGFFPEKYAREIKYIARQHAIKKGTFKSETAKEHQQ